MRCRRLPYSLCRLVGLMLLLCALSVGAADASKKRQAAVLARVLSYELTLGERAGSRVGIAVVYKPGDAKSEINAEEWSSALRELTALRIKDKPFFILKVAYAPNALLSAIENDGVDLLLLADGLGAELDAITRLTRAKRVLSASNDAAYAQKDVTVCVTEVEGKVKIVINLSSADKETIRFSSNLLKLATILH